MVLLYNPDMDTVRVFGVSPSLPVCVVMARLIKVSWSFLLLQLWCCLCVPLSLAWLKKFDFLCCCCCCCSKYVLHGDLHIVTIYTSFGTCGHHFVQCGRCFETDLQPLLYGNSKYKHWYFYVNARFFWHVCCNHKPNSSSLHASRMVSARIDRLKENMSGLGYSVFLIQKEQLMLVVSKVPWTRTLS